MDELRVGKTYHILSIFGKTEMRITHVQNVDQERLNLTGFHDEFYISDKGEKLMRSIDITLSIPIKHIINITEVAQGHDSLLKLKVSPGEK